MLVEISKKSVYYYEYTVFLNRKRGTDMDSIVERLDEIEKTAEAVVEHAREQKGEVEKEIQEKRDAFDRKLKQETSEELERIQSEAKAQMDRELEEQRVKNRSSVEALKKEYEKCHTQYAQEILRNILEV